MVSRFEREMEMNATDHLLRLWANYEKRISNLTKLGYSRSENPIKRYKCEANIIKRIVDKRQRPQYSDLIADKKYYEETEVQQFAEEKRKQ